MSIEEKITQPKFSKGDIVDFIGTKHFKAPNGKVFFTIKPGVAKVIAVDSLDSSYPYYLEAEPNSASTVKGWVAEKDIKGIHKRIVKFPISYASNKKGLKIGFIEDDNQAFQVSNWKQGGWHAVFRPKDSKLAEQLAAVVESGCSNSYIQYSDNVSIPFTKIAKNVNFKLNSIEEDVNINQLEFLLLIIEMFNIISANEISFANAESILIGSGLFYNFTSDDYLNRKDYLKRGDILFNNNYCAVVLSNGRFSNKLAVTKKPVQSTTTNLTVNNLAVSVSKNKIESKTKNEEVVASQIPELQNKTLSGTYITKTATELKDNISSQGNFITLPKGIKVYNYGFYEEDKNGKWLFVRTSYKNVNYSGFCNIENLIK